MFKGTYTAIVTPFRKGRLDEAALDRLIQLQIKAGVEGIVPAGTTGESPTLSIEEQNQVIAWSVRMAGKRIKVIAGTGGNSTAEALELTQAAERAGADASLQVAPYYNKPTQEGLFQHFRTIARSSRLPMVLYSVPSRCGIEIGVETVQRLVRECSNVIGIKEADGNPDRVSQFRSVLGTRFTILSGDDSLTLPFMSVGADGVISVASNVIPKEVARMVRAYGAGKLAAAQKIHSHYFELFRALFIESNPGPVKASLAMLGQIQEDYRLPMVRLAGENRIRLRKVLGQCGVLKSGRKSGS